MQRAFWFLATLLLGLIRTPGEEIGCPQIPFEFREGLLWIQASISTSAEPLNLLLDTGAAVSVLDRQTARRLGLKPGRAVPVRGVESTLLGRWLKPVSITADGIRLPANFLAVDLAKLSRSCQRPVDGLLGADFFRGRIIQIDFDENMVRILSAGRLPPGGETIPLERRPSGITIPLSVNGSARQWVRLDTGCASALQWVTSSSSPIPHEPQTAIGLTAISIPQTETSVRIGSHVFPHVLTGLHERSIFDGEAGLLGNALLCRFSRVTIDAKSGRLILEPKRNEP